MRRDSGGADRAHHARAVPDADETRCASATARHVERKRGDCSPQLARFRAGWARAPNRHASGAGGTVAPKPRRLLGAAARCGVRDAQGTCARLPTPAKPAEAQRACCRQRWRNRAAPPIGALQVAQRMSCAVRAEPPGSCGNPACLRRRRHGAPNRHIACGEIPGARDTQRTRRCRRRGSPHRRRSWRNKAPKIVERPGWNRPNISFELKSASGYNLSYRKSQWCFRRAAWPSRRGAGRVRFRRA